MATLKDLLVSGPARVIGKINASSFVKTGATADNILLAGGGDVAQSSFSSSSHEHSVSLVSGGTSTVNLAANTAYTLTVGGSSIVFKTPSDNNNNTVTTGKSDVVLGTTGVAVVQKDGIDSGTVALPSTIPSTWLGTSSTTAAAGNHTHSGYLTSHQTIKVDGVTGATTSHYGTCGTAAGTAAKAVSVTGTPTLEAGLRVIVKFTTTNSAASPTLNVNSLGAKSIYYRGSAITGSSNNILQANRVYEFVYDGTNWQLVGDINTNSGGTVTSVGLTNATNGGLNVSGSPVTGSGSITVGHTNVLSSAQNTKDLYPITFDINGHITSYGEAINSLSQFTNDVGFTTNTGTVTSVGITNGGGLTVTGSPVTGSGSITIGHTNTVTAGTDIGNNSTTTLLHNGTFIVPYFSYDTNGHITAASTKTLTLPDSGNTDNYGSVYVTTAGNTRAKIARVPWTYTLKKGNTFILYLQNSNTVTTSGSTYVTLNINSTGAKQVRINGAAPTTSNWTAGTYLCYYDGTYYQMYTEKNPFNYDDLLNKPTIPTVPTNVSAFNNDAGYTTNTGTVTSVGLSNATNGGLAISGSPITGSGSITIGHSNVLTSAQSTQAVYPITIDKNGHIASYGSAVTIPTVPSNIVNTITTTAGTHTAITSSTGNVSFNVPTYTSHLTNDSGFITSYVDENVKQTAVSTATTNDYPILFTYEASPTSGNAYGAKYSPKAKISQSGDIILYSNSTGTAATPSLIFRRGGAADTHVDYSIQNTGTFNVYAKTTGSWTERLQLTKDGNMTITGSDSTYGKVTANGFIKSGATTTNLLQAGGGDIALSYGIAAGNSTSTSNTSGVTNGNVHLNLTKNEGSGASVVSNVKMEGTSGVTVYTDESGDIVVDGAGCSGGGGSNSGVAYCNTAANTGDKVANLPGFSISTESPFKTHAIILYVLNSNTYSGTCTLNVNGIGAMGMRMWNGSSWSTVSGNMLKSGYYYCYYDGNSNSDWYLRPFSGGATYLSDLTDVESSPITGNVLQFNGTIWTGGIAVTNVVAGSGLNVTSGDTTTDGGQIGYLDTSGNEETISSTGTIHLTRVNTASSYNGTAKPGFGPTADKTVTSSSNSFYVPYYQVDKFGRVTGSVTRTITINGLGGSGGGSSVSVAASESMNMGYKAGKITVDNVDTNFIVPPARSVLGGGSQYDYTSQGLVRPRIEYDMTYNGYSESSSNELSLGTSMNSNLENLLIYTEAPDPSNAKRIALLPIVTVYYTNAFNGRMEAAPFLALDFDTADGLGLFNGYYNVLIPKNK